eukprot:6074552-Pyramimonas_sp.AAC.1
MSLPYTYAISSAWVADVARRSMRWEALAALLRWRIGGGWRSNQRDGWSRRESERKIERER